MKKKTWVGPPPQNCDLCRQAIVDSFVDGRNAFDGRWASMCCECFFTSGVGYGVGKGQRYQRNAAGVFEKVEG